MNHPRESTCCFGGGGNHQGCQPHPGAVDERLLVEELNQLSVQEREQVYNEIHGVAENVEETPEFLRKCCQELQEELKFTPGIKRRAYDKALFLKPSLEDDVKFQLMFLRSERYDAALAAKRLCLHFENKMMLFGEEKLVKDITLDDLDKEDIKASQLAGFISRMPEKDQSGRPVLFTDTRTLPFKTWQNMARLTWYVLMSEFTGEDTQKTGSVVVARLAGMSKHSLQMSMHGTPVLIYSLPVRFVAFHYCLDNRPSFAPLLSLLGVIGTQYRIRFRVHYGSEVEYKYILMTFGIRIPDYLIFGGRKEVDDMLAKYVSKRKKIEQEQRAEALQSLPPGLCALYPDPRDVLLGRGRSFQSFPGNKAMTATLDEYRDRYFSSSVRLDKAFLAIEIYQRITSNGGRFLERKERQGWKMVDRDVGEQKISRALRNRFDVEQGRSARRAHQKQEGAGQQMAGGLERTNKRARREPDGNDT